MGASLSECFEPVPRIRGYPIVIGICTACGENAWPSDLKRKRERSSPPYRIGCAGRRGASCQRRSTLSQRGAGYQSRYVYVIAMYTGWRRSKSAAGRRQGSAQVFVYMSEYVCEHVLSMYPGQPPRRSLEVLDKTQLPGPPQSVSLLLYTTNRARHLFPFEGGMHLHP